MPASASFIRFEPSNWKGFVTTPTVRMPASRAARAITGAAPVPVPPPMPAVMNTMLAPSTDAMMSSSASSAALRPTSGREPAPSPRVVCTPSWMRRSASDCCIACASVLQITKSQPTRFERIMLLTALPPAPPTPITVMRGLSSFSSWGMVRLMVILPSDDSYVFSKPSPQAENPPVRQSDGIAQRAGRFGLFRKREMHQAGGRREGGAGGRRRQPGDAARHADTDLLVEDQRGEFAHAGELARAARQHDAAARQFVEAGTVEPVAHHVECLFEARRDDPHEIGFRYAVGRRVLVVADLRHRDHLALVGRRGDAAALQRLHPLGFEQRRRQAAHNVVGDVVAADRD